MPRTDLPPLLYADTATSSDQLFFSGVEVPDPFIAFGARGRRISVQSSLEFGRVQKAGTFDHVLSLEEWRRRAEQAHPRTKAGPAEIIAELARHHRIRAFRVADDFPAALYTRLRALGLKLVLANGPLFPEREVKSAREAAAIREGNRLSALGLAAAEEILRASRPKNGRLLLRGKPLTSEAVKFAIESAILAAGGISLNTIVAGGDQGCDPHQRGFGPLRANALVVVDIFPRVVATGYFGDMTRTFLRGRASDAQRKLVETVRAAQIAATKAIRTDADGRAVHQQAVAVFEHAGYTTRSTAAGAEGFIHGTGHGLGLAIHEPPRLSPTSTSRLKRGSVVTVEPGLYYRGIGGCRIEDVVQVTDRAPRFLSNYPYTWELR